MVYIETEIIVETNSKWERESNPRYHLQFVSLGRETINFKNKSEMKKYIIGFKAYSNFLDKPDLILIPFVGSHSPFRLLCRN